MDIHELIADSEIDPNTHPDKTYEQGWAQGEEEATFLVSNRPSQNGHTLNRYCELRDRYITAAYSLQPTEWQRGYADGFDKVATDNGFNDDNIEY